MGKRLEREFEAVRKKMEEAATRLGLDHPEVHRLSKRLDGFIIRCFGKGKR